MARTEIYTRRTTSLQDCCFKAMHECTILITGFNDGKIEEKMKLELEKSIKKLGGAVLQRRASAGFFSHVVTSNALDKECIRWASTGTAIREPSWVQENLARNLCCNLSREPGLTDGIGSQCRVFYNVCVAISEVAGREDDLKGEVERNGGVAWTGDILDLRIHILVIGSPFGRKYNTAKRCFKIPCVSPSWISQSIAAGHALPPERFVWNRKDEFEAAILKGRRSRLINGTFEYY